MGYMTTVGGLLVVFAAAPVSASSYTEESNIDAFSHLAPLQTEALSSYRGGFRMSNDFTIDIGLSITTSFNGTNIFNNHIANFTIKNGNLDKVFGFNKSGVTNVIQVGEGNVIDQVSSNNAAVSDTVENSVASTTNTPESVTGSDVVGGANVNVETSVPDFTQSMLVSNSITNIIQNTMDNSTIGLSTVVSIDAQVSNIIQQIKVNQKLEDSILSSFY